jgi:hypothetical protein
MSSLACQRREEPEMPLLGPNDADKEKLHFEVSQIVNQRLQVTTLAVTIWGVGVAWLLPKDAPSESRPLGMFSYLASALLCAVLFALFVLNHQITQQLRILTTYLIESGASPWEQDWLHYRHRFPYIGYTKPQAVVFIVLGVLATALPFVLLLGFRFTIEPLAGALLTLATGATYSTLIFGMGIRGWGAKEATLALPAGPCLIGTRQLNVLANDRCVCAIIA